MYCTYNTGTSRSVEHKSQIFGFRLRLDLWAHKSYINNHVLKLLTVLTSGCCVCVFACPQHVPPLVVTDLFEDIKDGVMLLALLEVLSGQKLVSTGLVMLWIHVRHQLL